jgi:N-acetylglucosamine-6-phosphate deacetylase
VGSLRIEAGRVLTPDGGTRPGAVVVEDGVIVAIEPAADALGPSESGRILVPGFVDLQVNGIDDVDVARAHGADWDRLDQLLLAQGVTSWCATLVTSPITAYGAALERIEQARRREPVSVRPELLGAHLEGPFLGAATGAHRPDLVLPIDLEWLAALPDTVRVVTLGAEQPLAAEAARLLRSRGVTVSIGHSRPAPDVVEQRVEEVVGAGAGMVTHLFNAMSGVHHRQPGLAALALTDERLALGLIADGTHVHPRVINLVFRAAADRVVLVTDAVAWRAGTAGSTSLALVDGVPRLPDGTLAGSALTMDAAIRTCVHQAGVPLAAAVAAASTHPARVLGLADRGRIEVGCRADLVALDEDLLVAATWVGGEPGYERDRP